MLFDPEAEWLESDGHGGFASGTAGLIRTRRYHALLLSATEPPAGRMVLVNGLEAWVTTASGRVAISAQRYGGDVIHPDGQSRISAFTHEPWPTWIFALGETEIVQEILVDPERCETVLRWRRVAGDGPCGLDVRLLVSGRDFHALHHENPAFDFATQTEPGRVVLRPYPGVPAITALANGGWRDDPLWFRNVLYTTERARGMDALEDVAAPGVFTWDLAAGPAVVVLCAGEMAFEPAVARAEAVIAMESLLRERFPSALARAADAYIVDRGAGRTIIAGYPWFGDWGRDTFISMRGLTLATGRLADAEAILTAWAGSVSEGMLPNHFPDRGETPLYNSVDASLWFVVAVHDFLERSTPTAQVRATLWRAVLAVIEGYRNGTRFGIRADTDGLIRAGEPGVQLTWMDAKVGDWVVTPRIGKPVEVQALWINALRIAARENPDYGALAERATASFHARFPDPATGGLFDVVDADHEPGRCDARIRPNQIFAVGGLPFQIVSGDIARGVVELVERELLTPIGLRSLSRADPEYAPHYRGDRVQRDGAYHQGTVWPFLTGSFIEAWLRVNGADAAHRDEARRRFLDPLLKSMHTFGLGHICEVADGDPPHTPGGCPFQAWSVGEALRAERLLSGEPSDAEDLRDH